MYLVDLFQSGIVECRQVQLCMPCILVLSVFVLSVYDKKKKQNYNRPPPYERGQINQAPYRTTIQQPFSSIIQTSKLELKRTNDLDILCGMVTHMNCTTADGYLAVKDSTALYLRNIHTGSVINSYDVFCKCKPKYQFTYAGGFHLCEIKCREDSNKYIVGLCRKCNMVGVVDRAHKVQYKAFLGHDRSLSAMCEGPDGTLLAWDQKNKVILQFEWNEGDKQFYQIRTIKKHMRNVMAMCFDERHNTIVFTFETLEPDGINISAVYLDTEDVAWYLKKSETQNMKFNDLCSDDKGHIFVVNSKFEDTSIVVLCGATGYIFLEEKTGQFLHDVCWLRTTNQLITFTGLHYISYDIKNL